MHLHSCLHQCLYTPLYILTLALIHTLLSTVHTLSGILEMQVNKGIALTDIVQEIHP